MKKSILVLVLFICALISCAGKETQNNGKAKENSNPVKHGIETSVTEPSSGYTPPFEDYAIVRRI